VSGGLLGRFDHCAITEPCCIWLTQRRTLASRFLVASQPVRDLLLCAKDLFIAAMVSVDGQPSLLVGSRSCAERRWIEQADGSSELGCFVRPWNLVALLIAAGAFILLVSQQ